MTRASITLHAIHLYRHGHYHGTLPHVLTSAAAEAFVATYNRINRRQGRAARAAAHRVAIEASAMLQRISSNG